MEETKLDTAESLANYLNCSKAKIRKDTRLTKIPRIRMGRSVRYERSAVLEWLKNKPKK